MAKAVEASQPYIAQDKSRILFECCALCREPVSTDSQKKKRKRIDRGSCRSSLEVLDSILNDFYKTSLRHLTGQFLYSGCEHRLTAIQKSEQLKRTVI